MGIRIKKVHIKPGTLLSEGVLADHDMLTEDELKTVDKEGWIWCQAIYVGFNYERQVLYTYLDEYWPDNNVLSLVDKLPEELDPDVELTEPFYLIEPEEGLIGYDITDKNLWNKEPLQHSLIWSEMVGEIRLRPKN